MSTWAQIASKIEPNVFNKEINTKEIKTKEVKTKEVKTKVNTKEINKKNNIECSIESSIESSSTEIDIKKKYNDELAMFLKKYYEEN